MEGYDVGAYKRIYHGLLASLLTSLILFVVLGERVCWALCTPEADHSLCGLLMAALQDGPDKLQGVVQLTDTVRTALRLLATIPLITGLGDVIAASRHFRVARNLILIRFILDALFTFAEVLLLSLETRGLVQGSAEEAGSRMRVLFNALDIFSFLIIGYFSSIRLLKGFDGTMRSVGMEGRGPYLRRIWRAVLGACITMSAALLVYAAFWLAGIRLPSLPAFLALAVVALGFLTRFILRVLIVREARRTMKIIGEISR